MMNSKTPEEVAVEQVAREAAADFVAMCLGEGWQNTPDQIRLGAADPLVQAFIDFAHRIEASHASGAMREAVFRPLYTAERKFTNSVGSEIEIYVSTGSAENRLCKTTMYGPHSSFENYTTWDELVQLSDALNEALATPAPDTAPQERAARASWERCPVATNQCTENECRSGCSLEGPYPNDTVGLRGEVPTVTPEAIDAALHARVPGGAEVRYWLPQADDAPHQTARNVMEAALNAAIRKLAASPGEGRGEVEDLKARLRMIVAHATGGHWHEQESLERSVNDICVQISAHRNRVWQHAQEVALRDAALTPSVSTGQDLREALKKIAHTAYGYECRNIARAALASTGRDGK